MMSSIFKGQIAARDGIKNHHGTGLLHLHIIVLDIACFYLDPALRGTAAGSLRKTLRSDVGGADGEAKDIAAR